MNRRAFIKKTVPISVLIAGCTSGSDDTENKKSTQTSTVSTLTMSSTNATTRNPTSNATSQRRTTSSTTKPTTSSTTERTTSKSTSQQTTSSTTKHTTSTTRTQSTTERKTTTSSSSTPDHPSTNGVFDEPRRGPKPFSKDATLIVFEDPSCPNCVHFEQKTYPKLKRKYSDTGKLSIIFRTIPVVQPWGEQATYALESTYIRQESAYWKLKSYYFDNQDQFSTDNVLSKTENYLDRATHVRGKDVVRDVQSKAQKSQVQEDLITAKKAGIRGTPTSIVFRERNYVTDVIGRQSYSVFKNILGL